VHINEPFNRIMHMLSIYFLFRRYPLTYSNHKLILYYCIQSDQSLTSHDHTITRDIVAPSPNYTISLTHTHPTTIVYHSIIFSLPHAHSITLSLSLSHRHRHTPFHQVSFVCVHACVYTISLLFCY